MRTLIDAMLYRGSFAGGSISGYWTGQLVGTAMASVLWITYTGNVFVGLMGGGIALIIGALRAIFIFPP